MQRARLVRKLIPVAIVLAVAAVLGIRLSFLLTDRIAPGVRSGGVDIGGLTRDAARSRLQEWARGRLAGGLVFTARDRKWTATLRDLGVTIDIPLMLRAAYSIGRRGNVLVRTGEALGVLSVPGSLPAVYRCNEKRVGRLLAKVQAEVATPAKDARLSFPNGVRTIAPEVLGTAVDRESAIERIHSALATEASVVVVPIVRESPEVTTRDLLQIDTILSSFTTRFPAWRRDRTHNIGLAVSRIDGTIIKPGEVFSYNDTVGPRKKKNGFKDALIYVKGKIIAGTGGGVCQVSSTVYNAALLANLQIVERSHHSMPVPYLPLGRDATVAYGLLDLKFRNTASAPVYVAAKMVANRLTIQVYGAVRDKKDVRIYTARVKGGRKSRMAVAVYRAVMRDGVEESRQRISSDVYSPAPPHEARPAPKPVRVAARR